MIIKTENKEITIIPKIKAIIDLTNKLNGKNLHQVFFKGASDNNLSTLCMILEAFSYENEGKDKAFKKIEEVYDFLEEYLVESKKTTADVYFEIAEVVNNLGFFNKKMTTEELKSSLTDSLDLDMDAIAVDIVKKVSEEKMRPMIEEEFKGFKA